MSRSTTLILGIAVGAVGVALYTRLRAQIEDEDPEALIEKLSRQLQTLEDREKKSAPSASE